MSFTLIPAMLYTLAVALILIAVNTLWAIGHAVAAGEFDYNRLPDFIVDDLLKVFVLATLALAAMVRLTDADPEVIAILSGLKVLFGVSSVAFLGSLSADIYTKFTGKFSVPVEPRSE